MDSILSHGVLETDTGKTWGQATCPKPTSVIKKSDLIGKSISRYFFSFLPEMHMAINKTSRILCPNLMLETLEKVQQTNSIQLNFIELVDSAQAEFWIAQP